VAKGGWKRKLGWVLIAVLVVGILLAATWRVWLLQAIRLAVGVRGVQVASVKWQGNDSLEFLGVDYARGGIVARAKSVVILTPPAWRRALCNSDTNQTYFTVSGWRVILSRTNGVSSSSSSSSSTNSIAQKIQKLNETVHRFQKQCPRALIQNGTLQTAKGEFNFGAVKWKGGELSGDFTWPQLNDPADFKLKIVDASKLQLIVKQIALEIGARATAETLADGARLSGYARWKTNRLDFDATFATGDDTPRFAVVDSKGLAVPGRFVGMPDVEALNAPMHLVITNGQFDFALGAPPPTESGSESSGPGQ
jgi:hypothetical protein